MISGPVVIAGIGEAASSSGVLALHGRDLYASVARSAVADAGLTFADVDGVAAVGSLMQASELAEHLGIRPTWVDTTMTGGSSFEVLVQHATDAIRCDHAEVVLIAYAETPRGDRGRGATMPYWLQRDTNIQELESPFGLRQPLGPYALAKRRHMHCFGTTDAQFAEIAVSTRQWAGMNPDARLQDPITVDDVLASPFEVDPLHRAEVCLVTDGAGAIVLTRADRVADLRHEPVSILGSGYAQSHSLLISEMPDLTVTAGVESGRRAFAEAGITPDDVDLVMTYDSFTVTVLLALEDLGFCAKGDGGSFVSNGRLAPGGALPTNTNGGGLSYTHPGMYGMFLLTEAVRQLRGEAGQRQVDGAEVAVAHGCGAVLSTFGTVVLGRGIR